MQANINVAAAWRRELKNEQRIIAVAQGQPRLGKRIADPRLTDAERLQIKTGLVMMNATAR